MGDEGIGPSTSVLSGQRSTTELVAQFLPLFHLVTIARKIDGPQTIFWKYSISCYNLDYAEKVSIK